MRKANAIRVFGSGAELARAIGITRFAIRNWPEELTDRQADRVIAACVRRGIDPSPLLEEPAERAA